MLPSFQSLAPTARLSDRVAEALAQEIRAGRIAAGDRLPTETALAEQFAVSRTVVREALSRLKSLELIYSRQGSGVFVRELRVEPLHFDPRHAASREAVIQFAEMRRALEAEVAALAAERGTAEDLAAIRIALAAIEAATAAGGDGVAEDLHFHQALAHAAHNPFLIGTLQYLGQFLRGAIQVTRANEARRTDFAQQVAQEHACIVDAVEARMPEAARQAAARHMDNAIRRIHQADPVFWQQEGAQLASPLVSAGAAAD